MKLPTILFSLILFCLFTFSCGSDFYVPRPANLLILEDKKDIKASIAFNSVQAAYSPINHLGTKASYTFSNINVSRASRSLGMANFGLGYYMNKEVEPLRSDGVGKLLHPKPPLIGFEIYGNIAQGKFDSFITSGAMGGIFALPNSQGFRSFEANLLNPHLSSQIYWQSQSFSLQFGVRAGLLYFYNGVGFGDYSAEDLNLANELIDDTPYTNFEFDILLSKGNDRIETFAQVSWNNTSNELIDNTSVISFGLKMNIPKLINSLKKIKDVEKLPR